mgnify:CR=1 FL=1
MTITVTQTVETRIRISTDNREGSILLKQKEGLTPTKLHTPPLEGFCSLNTENTLGHASCVPLQCYAWSRSLHAVTKCLLYVVLLLMGPSVTIPPDNTWHACGTVPDVSYPLRLFGIQNVEDARLRACVLSYLWRSFVGGIVDRLLLLPMWGY